MQTYPTASSRTSPAPCQPIFCTETVDFQSLLKASTLFESERISGYRYGSLDDSAQHDSPPEGELNSSTPTLNLEHAKCLDPSPLHFYCIPPERGRKRSGSPISDSHVPAKKVVHEQVVPIASDVNLSALPASKGAYSAKREKQDVDSQRVHTLQELKQMGFEIIAWDGKCDRPLVDKDGVIFGVMAGTPTSPGYQEAAKAAYEFMLEESRRADFAEVETAHRRGKFPAVNVGVTHGKGTIRPVVLDNKQHKAMVERLRSHKGIRRMAAHASTSFAIWSPDVYLYYKYHLDKLFANMPFLRRNFKDSIFPSATFNLGPNVWTYKHRNALNCPFGWCSVQALGDFDPTKGGHLILWELKLAIEFPTGSTILFPSATITHSNVPVAEGEKRLSFTQYAAGGLFRYVDYGFRTEKALKRDRPSYDKACEECPKRWETGLALLRNLKDMRK